MLTKTKRHFTGFFAIGLASLFVISCGTKKKSTTSSAKVPDFSTVINPILKKSCSGNTTCHGVGEGSTTAPIAPVYVNNAANLQAEAAKAITYINSTDVAIKMPKPGFGISLSSADKATLLSYLNYYAK